MSLSSYFAGVFTADGVPKLIFPKLIKTEKTNHRPIWSTHLWQNHQKDHNLLWLTNEKSSVLQELLYKHLEVIEVILVTKWGCDNSRGTFAGKTIAKCLTQKWIVVSASKDEQFNHCESNCKKKITGGFLGG